MQDLQSTIQIPIPPSIKDMNAVDFAGGTMSGLAASLFGPTVSAFLGRERAEEFKEAAKLNNLDWELLAAIAFQESQWNPKARSATQVKGMMMLTLPTAKSLGVDNRLDPVQSINGGASYIAKLIDEINFGTSTGDTISIALAAYNLGVGNINRYLEEIQINLNKENFEITWDDLSSFLTEEVNHNELIGNSTNYKRGIQAVDYVTRVKDYYYLILGLGCN